MAVQRLVGELVGTLDDGVLGVFRVVHPEHHHPDREALEHPIRQASVHGAVTSSTWLVAPLRALMCSGLVCVTRKMPSTMMVTKHKKMMMAAIGLLDPVQNPSEFPTLPDLLHDLLLPRQHGLLWVDRSA